jgi:hypothetical protein
MVTRRRPYGLPEAAKRLGIAPESVLLAIKKGRIKGKKKTVLIKKTVWQLSPKSVESYEVSISHQERGRKNP